MEFNDYYKNELNTLRIEGSEFSKKNPGLSTYLSKPGQDPDVERLLEGFAFLTGKLKQQLDQELPEVAHTLVQLLWPNYVRPIPSYCIIRYKGTTDSTENVIIEKNTPVLSNKPGLEAPCKFRTTYETTIMPLEISQVEYFQTDKKSSISLFLEMCASGTLNDISFDTIRLFLGGSKFISKDIYLLMQQYVESIDISILDEKDEIIKTINIDADSISKVGFENSQQQAPYPVTVYDGYILLQEYFCYPDKFSFLDVGNLKAINNISKDILLQSKKLSLNFNFISKLKSSEAPNKENFQLHCTPIINIFETDSVPIRKNATEEEYLLVPSDVPSDKSEVFSVLNVRGWMPKKNAYEEYALFESFNHNDDSEYYSSRVKFSDAKDATQTYLRFASNDGLYDNVNNSTASISVKILCTNKNEPNNMLLLGDINEVDPLAKNTKVKFENITIPSPSYNPPINGDFLWKIVSNMSLNFLSLDTAESLRTIIDTYDFIGAYDIAQKNKTSMMLGGLKSISHKSEEMLYRGLPIRGIKATVDINPNKFDSLGEVYIFSSILNEFLSLYSNINSFHQLIVNVDNEGTFVWKHKMGSRSLI
jgi:type VI secretion system protein ImpG